MQTDHEVRVNLLQDLADYYRTEIAVKVLDMYARDLTDVPMDDLRIAIAEYRTWPGGHDDFPRPSQLMPNYFWTHRPEKPNVPLTIVSN